MLKFAYTYVIYLQFSPKANNFTEGNETFLYLLIEIDILFKVDILLFTNSDL
jgi:hypothetical protein